MIDLANLGKVLLLIAVFLPVRFAQDWTFYPDTAFIEQMNLRVENSLVSSVPYHLFWFGQHDRTIQLYCNSLLGNHPLELYALTKRETIVKAPVAQLTGGFRLDKDYSGTIGATLPRLQVDFNQDGRLEKLQLTAKIDTLFAQPFHPIRTAFKDPRIPLEVCFKGDRSILILLNGQPLRQETIRLVSRRGYGCNSDRTAITDSAGMLQVDDVRDLLAIKVGIKSIISRAIGWKPIQCSPSVINGL
jgi:hypothetical protein